MLNGAIDAADYSPVAVTTLRPAARLGFDLFLLRDDGRAPAIYWERDRPLTQADIDGLVSGGIEHLYVNEREQSQYHRYLGNNLDALLSSETTGWDVRCRFLHAAAREMLQSAIRIIEVGRYVEVAQRLAGHLTQLLRSARLTPAELYALMPHDGNLFTHIINVSAYSLLLAQKLGIRSQAKLRRIAAGALLHDLGMRSVPSSALEGALLVSQREREQLRRHPQSGYEVLCDRTDLEWGQLMMVYQHHERCDASGYPVRLPAAEIHWMAKLCAIADTFDLMTRPRRGSTSLSCEQANRYFDEDAGRLFDREMVQCWTS